MSGRQLREIAHETVEILGRGWYQAPGAGQVILSQEIAAAVAGTRLYLPEDELAPPAQPATGTVVEVTGETTLAAARRLGGDVAALVFASAKNPGGGFLSGAQAQEEALARASALYACQTAAGEFYDFHRHQRDLRYSDRVIYSPAVPVFRADDGTLLGQRYLVSFLTAAAPNLRAIRSNGHGTQDSVPAVLARRAARVLQVMAAHRHRRLVLGAWGCGVFGNDPALVAAIFADLLPEHSAFDHVVFAVYDARPGAPAYQAFAEVLA